MKGGGKSPGSVSGAVTSSLPAHHSLVLKPLAATASPTQSRTFKLLQSRAAEKIEGSKMRQNPCSAGGCLWKMR